MNDSDELDRALEKVSEVNLYYEIGLILLIVSIALRLISLAGYLIMGSIGIISLPSFLVSHDFLLTTLGAVVFLTGFLFAAIAYLISKESSRNTIVAASLAFIGSMLPPLDIFMILGAILLFLSLKKGQPKMEW
ncbi:MAG: hypothetical protein H0Z28_05580 [Archaeoglobus sp.]|nr:hypothetical protein [Archaeoglobus sp.]